MLILHVHHNGPPKPTSTQPVAAASHMLNSNPDTEPAGQHMRLARTVQRPPEPTSTQLVGAAPSVFHIEPGAAERPVQRMCRAITSQNPPAQPVDTT